MSRSSALFVLFVAVFVVYQTETESSSSCCPMNQTFSSCGRGCEPTCDHPDQNVICHCPVDIEGSGTGGCRCDGNHVRDTRIDRCILVEDC
ncbi:cysteine-rich venom protein 6-like [Xylocopa sonorina]|uniref:cysteine-rich venom protein 6-like n=1 Tax=Xylocopa sonorina TaxID=1818115 RepID=UPI00403B2E6A